MQMGVSAASQPRDIHNELTSFNVARKEEEEEKKMVDHIPEIIHPSGTQRYIIPVQGGGRSRVAAYVKVEVPLTRPRSSRP